MNVPSCKEIVYKKRSLSQFEESPTRQNKRQKCWTGTEAIRQWMRTQLPGQSFPFSVPVQLGSIQYRIMLNNVLQMLRKTLELFVHFPNIHVALCRDDRKRIIHFYKWQNHVFAVDTIGNEIGTCVTFPIEWFKKDQVFNTRTIFPWAIEMANASGQWDWCLDTNSKPIMNMSKHELSKFRYTGFDLSYSLNNWFKLFLRTNL